SMRAGSGAPAPAHDLGAVRARRARAGRMRVSTRAQPSQNAARAARMTSPARFMSEAFVEELVQKSADVTVAAGFVHVKFARQLAHQLRGGLRTLRDELPDP